MQHILQNPIGFNYKKHMVILENIRPILKKINFNNIM